MTIWRTLRCWPSDCDAVLEVLLDLVLVAGVGVDGVPAKHAVSLTLARGLEDGLDEPGEDRVEQAEVAARDHDEPSTTQVSVIRARPVGPLDAPELGPDGDQEVYEPRAAAACFAALRGDLTAELSSVGVRGTASGSIVSGRCRRAPRRGPRGRCSSSASSSAVSSPICPRAGAERSA